MPNNKIIFWKLLDCSSLSDHVKALKAADPEVEKKYTLADNDVGKIDWYLHEDELPLIAILHKDVTEKGVTEDRITGAFLCKVRFGDGHGEFFYRSMQELSLDLTFENVSSLSMHDLKKDYAKESYIVVEDSPIIAAQLASYLCDQTYPARAFKPSRSSAGSVGNRAFPVGKCTRLYGPISSFDTQASEFRKDAVAITNSRAFRRTVDKAQIFGAEKGDHYRTRMTHTQVVTQIAIAISKRLKLNLDLTEAIALGHDIGHTPFGHQGERTLDDILRGNGYGIIRNAELLSADFVPKQPGETNYKLQPSSFGFKHNYQSLRVAASEETSFDYPGLNLTVQTQEGMLKHTKLKQRDPNNPEAVPDALDITDFTDIPENGLHLDVPFARTLEGQVVAIADEIAQRAHDLDDALLSGEFGLDDFKKYLLLRKFNSLGKLINEATRRLDEKKISGFSIHNDTRLTVSRLVENFTKYFVNDVVKETESKLGTCNCFRGDLMDKQYVQFSNEVKEQNSYIEKLIASRVVINNREVAVFDSNAASVVSGLFKAYYENPRLLPAGTKRVLYARLRRETTNVIDFITGSSKLVRKEYEKMTTLDLSDLTRDHSAEREKLLMEYRMKRRMLVRTICDYIAGMTDSFARAEYARLVPNIAKLQTDYSKESGKKA